MQDKERQDTKLRSEECWRSVRTPAMLNRQELLHCRSTVRKQNTSMRDPTYTECATQYTMVHTARSWHWMYDEHALGLSSR